jgi:hypothetical protein
MRDIEAIAASMREPKVRDIRMLKNIKDEKEQEIELIANLSGLTKDELDELSLKEYGVLQKRLASFLS